jgi:hypothetical protein
LATAARPADIPLQVSYRDAVGPIRDGVRSDGLMSFTGSPYQYVHGPDDNALAIIQSTGNYRFSTRLDQRKPLRRRLCFDFGVQPVPLPSPYCADVLIGMHGDGYIQDMHHGDVLNKRARHSWVDGGYEYALGYGIDADGDGVLFDTPPALVTCSAPAESPSSLCTLWTMSGDQASLSRRTVTSNGKYGPIEVLGFYDMPFQVTFARK